MKIKNRIALVALVLAFCMMSLFACTPNTTNQAVSVDAGSKVTTDSKSEATPVDVPDTVELRIIGVGIDITLSLEDMKALDQEVITSTNIDSKGDVKETTIEGFSLTKLLEKNNIDQKTLDMITFIATDGYTMSLPKEISGAKELYIALKQDGEFLAQPRSVVPDERAMFWVRMLSEIEIEKADTQSAVTIPTSRVIVFQSAVRNLEPMDYVDGQKADKVYSIKQFCEMYVHHADVANVNITAIDGFAKQEKVDIFTSAYICLEGESAPLYLGEKINNGMRVKQILTARLGMDCIYFAQSEMSVSDLFNEIDMENADFYRFIGADDYAVEIAATDIGKGNIVIDNEGNVRAVFEGLEKDSVKELLYIEAVK